MALVKKYLSSAAEQVDTWLSDSRGSIRQSFRNAWTQVKKDAEALRESGDVAAAISKLRGRGSRRDAFSGRQDDSSASLRQREGDRATNPASTTCDEGVFSV